jgi:hypothetical protein
MSPLSFVGASDFFNLALKKPAFENALRTER